jgi:Cu(I)/Ag(I) efflux system membrane protein CusA/SilA
MIESVIRWSIGNRALVLIMAAFLVVAGAWAVRNTPVDAIPDLSDVQVIIKTRFPGQSPQVVEDQVTYPLTSAMLAVPGAVTVRGFSFFGDSYVYVIFEEGTDLYWARARVLEYLSQVAPALPEAARPQLGPDATGVGWVYQYALVDRTGRHDLSQLRSFQDWFLKYELQAVPGVAEVATIGGMVKQYQVIVHPDRLRAFALPLSLIQTAIREGNQEIGASVIEMAEAEYMVTSSGYLTGKDDLGTIPLGVSENGVPLLLQDVADIRVGPQMRRGVAELNGEGEVVGGIIVARFGANAGATIEAVKARIEALQPGFPAGIELVTVYDRSDLIDRAVANLWGKLGEELLLVAVVCMAFLFHIRSALVAVITLPVGMLCAFVVMQMQGLSANIMSLGGIAIAIGTMIDGAIVLIENVHKHIEEEPAEGGDRWRVVTEAAVEVGPSLFFSLLIITVSFLPVFTLEAQEGRMFAPLAYTKTYAMGAAAILAVTLVPVLLGYFVRGRVRPESDNPLNRSLLGLYRPLLRGVLRHPRAAIAMALVAVLLTAWPASQLGREFMPPLDEGDLMYMPTTYPGISIGKARQLLQQTDRLIATLPEVKSVFGKVGRAETATDPAPLNMIETVIQFKPRDQWRPGMTPERIREELDARIKIPGLTNAWVMPIKTRIDMLATGIKTPVGIKIAGPSLAGIERIGKDLERILGEVPGTVSVFSERVAGGRYVRVDIDREKAARYGLSVRELQQVIAIAVGGMNLTETVEGLERYPVNLRYPQSFRDSPDSLSLLPVVTPAGQRIALGDVTSIHVDEGPPGIKSENARINGWTYVDIAAGDIGSYISAAQQAIADKLSLPPGYSLTWSGQYEYMQRALDRLAYMLPLTLSLIILLLFLNFRRLAPVLILLATLPVSLVGSVWMLYLLDYNLSIAVGVGTIALLGVAAETGVIMLSYLDSAWLKSSRHGCTQTASQVIENGAMRRLRPVIMTATATIVGLVPILFGAGTGSEIMSRLSAPMVGGMLTTVLMTLFVLPAVYLIWRGRTEEIPASQRSGNGAR